MGDHEHTLDACRMMNHRRSEASHHYRVDYEHMLQSCRMINDSDSEDEDPDIVAGIAVVMKRRWLAARAAMKRQKSGPRGKKRRGTSFSWEEHVERLSPREFKDRYRHDNESFGYLHTLLKPRIDTKDIKQVSALFRPRASVR